MEKLFTYGSLQFPDIQEKLFSRTLSGTPDTLVDYGKRKIEIEGEIFNIADLRPGSKIDGIVYELNEKELQKSDIYEGSDYKRIKVKLLSGVESWLYIARSTLVEVEGR
jgi:gamma-glutamylcyclotransferase (GGCT)/AIG2-like uncharacterized protein YtfP